MELLLVTVALSIPLTWVTFKITGIVLFILSVVVLISGSLPGNEGSDWGNGLRWVVWPAFLVWIIVFVVRGFLV